MMRSMMILRQQLLFLHLHLLLSLDPSLFFLHLAGDLLQLDRCEGIRNALNAELRIHVLIGRQFDAKLLFLLLLLSGDVVCCLVMGLLGLDELLFDQFVAKQVLRGLRAGSKLLVVVLLILMLM